MLNEKIIAIEKGRDAGKSFKVKEMPVTKLEKWAARALLAVFGSEMPADVRTLSVSSNTAALLSAGLGGLSGLRWEQAEPLYDELLGQIYRVPNPRKPDDAIRLTPQNLDAHVEDVGTIYLLRWEAIRLSGFFAGRRGLDLPPVVDPQPLGLRDYANLPGCVGIPVTRRRRLCR